MMGEGGGGGAGGGGGGMVLQKNNLESSTNAQLTLHFQKPL